MAAARARAGDSLLRAGRGSRRAPPRLLLLYSTQQRGVVLHTAHHPRLRRFGSVWRKRVLYRSHCLSCSFNAYPFGWNAFGGRTTRPLRALRTCHLLQSATWFIPAGDGRLTTIRGMVMLVGRAGRLSVGLLCSWLGVMTSLDTTDSVSFLLPAYLLLVRRAAATLPDMRFFLPYNCLSSAGYCCLPCAWVCRRVSFAGVCCARRAGAFMRAG